MRQLASGAPRRPALRYHGGKWRLAPWILSFFPPHRIYVEPYAGAASVLMRKPRSYGEVYNDLDGDVVNVFRVLQNPVAARQLARRVALTAYARTEFKRSYQRGRSPVDRAWRTIARAFMGFGSASTTRMHITGFRSNVSRSGTIPASDWANWPTEVRAFTERLRGVVIESRPAITLMRQHDRIDALHYVDPPYVQDTRSSLSNKNGNRGHYYRHDMTDKDHRELAAVLRELEGMVVLSGYGCRLYDEELFPDWERHSRRHMADGARARTEVVWLNPACSAALRASRAQLEAV